MNPANGFLYSSDICLIDSFVKSVTIPKPASGGKINNAKRSINCGSTLQDTNFITRMNTMNFEPCPLNCNNLFLEGKHTSKTYENRNKQVSHSLSIEHFDTVCYDQSNFQVSKFDNQLELVKNVNESESDAIISIKENYGSNETSNLRQLSRFSCGKSSSCKFLTNTNTIFNFF